MRKKILSRQFFNRPTLQVAKDLLGKFLVRKIDQRIIAVKITEVEAYDGPKDKASHASRGQTPRNAPMWGVAGQFYIYFTYGMHWMLNVVTGEQGYPAAILIRAGEKYHVSGIKYQGKDRIIKGPARLTKYLRIDKKLNGKPAERRSGLWLEDRGMRISKSKIIAGPRIGVDYAGAWAKKPYNFKLD